MKTIMKLFLFCVFLAANTSAVAHEARAYLDASKEFEGLVAQSQSVGKMPRIEDKKVAGLITVLSDSERFLKSPTYFLQDVDALMDICEKSKATVMSYVLFDFKKIDPRGAQVALQLSRLTEKNIQTFQGELEQLQPFQIRCMGKAIPLLNDFVTSLPPHKFTETRRTGFQQMRAGIMQDFTTILRDAYNTAYNESYRLKLLQALSDSASAYSSALQPASRRQLRELAKSGSGQAGVPKDFNPYIEQISNALAGTDCVGLCGL